MRFEPVATSDHLHNGSLGNNSKALLTKADSISETRGAVVRFLNRDSVKRNSETGSDAESNVLMNAGAVLEVRTGSNAGLQNSESDDTIANDSAERILPTG